VIVVTRNDIDGGRLAGTGGRQRPVGSVSGVAPPGDIHRVCKTGDTVAITLHVYGAYLSQGTSVRRIYLQRPARLRPPGTSREVRNGSRLTMGGDR
jgi:3-mercaptopropionate dioxygenase